jgi:hypothetical protein
MTELGSEAEPRGPAEPVEPEATEPGMAPEPAPPAPPPAFVWETASSQPAPAGWSAGPGAPSGGMNSSALIDRSTWIYRRGFVILLSVAAVVQVPLAIVNALAGQRIAEAVTPFGRFAGGSATPDELVQTLRDVLPALSGPVLLVALVGFIGGLLLSPALIATVARINAGEPASLSDSYGTAVRRAPAIFVGSIVQGFAAGVLFIAIVFVGALLDSAGLGGALVISVLVAFVAVIYVIIRLAVWTQVVVLEGRDPLDALTRSWRLVGGAMWRTLALLFVTVLLTAVAGAILGVIAGIPGSVLPASWRGVIPDILSIVYVSWLPIAMTLLFLDLRARREGVTPTTDATATAESTAPGAATAQ